MSWIRSALNRAAEVGGKNIAPNLRTVRNYAGNVYQQAGHAVAGGAKLFQHRLSGKNLTSLKTAVKRLDAVSLNVRGAERVLALERWSQALKDIDSLYKKSLNKSDADDGAEGLPSPNKRDDHEKETLAKKGPTVVFFEDDDGGQLANFRDVFLRSHALENIVTSLIIEAPQDEEIVMLGEILRYCLAGGQELHIALISGIQDLARAFSAQMEETMIKRSQLLQLVRDAIIGLKLCSEVERLDVEILSLQEQISTKNGQLVIVNNSSTTQEASIVSESEGLEITQEILKLGMHLQTCLAKKKDFSQIGDTPANRAEKVSRLKEVSKELVNIISQRKKEIDDIKLQQEKTLQYRVKKFQETSELEKAVAVEVRALDKRRRELEDELKEVKSLLASATARHINIQEQKEQFDDANSNIIGHLSFQEQELSRNVVASSAEAAVVGTWVNFLEDTWLLQSQFFQETEEDMKRTFQEGTYQFVNAALGSLSFHENQVRALLQQMKSVLGEFKMRNDARIHVDDSRVEHSANISKLSNTYTTQLLANYQEAERQIVNTFSTLFRLKEEVHSFGQETNESESDLLKQASMAFGAIEELKKEFESLEKPEAFSPISKVPPESSTDSPKEVISEKDHAAGNLLDSNEVKEPVSFPAFIQADASPRKNSEDTHADPGLETEGWDLDELEEALNTAALG